MSTPPSIPRKRRWPHVLGAILLLLGALYFTVTSSVFIKAVVLPQVASALKSDLTVGGLAIRPFSSLTLTDVKLTPNGAEPLATVRQIHARYDLWSIIRGTIRVDEATVEGVDVTLVEGADGKSNLSRLLEGLASDPKKAPSALPKLEIRNVSIKNGTLHHRRQKGGASGESFDVTNLNVSLDQLVNGQTGRLNLAAEARAQNLGQPPGNAGIKIGGAFDVALNDALLPQVVKGSLRIDLAEGTASLQAFAGLSGVLDIDLTGTEVRELALRFSQNGRELGRISVQGPFDLSKKEARLSYEVRGLDRRVLALAGAASGLDFGDVTVGATGRVDVANGGSLLASNGRLTVNQFSLGGPAGRSPVLNVSSEYRFSVNQSEHTALVDTLDLLVKQGSTELMKGGLDRAMNLAWDKALPGFRESTYTVTLSGVDLSQWRSLLPSNAPTAVVRGEFRVKSEKDGRLLRYTLDATIDKLSASVGGAQIQGATAAVKLAGTSSDFKVFNAESFSLEVREGRDQLISATGMADWHIDDQQGGLQFSLEGQLPALLALYPIPRVLLRSGALKISSASAKRSLNASASLSVNLSGVTGTVGQVQLNQYQGTVDASVSLDGHELDVQRANLTAQTGFAPGGGIDLRGKFDLVKRSGTFDFKAVNLNESALGPFVAPSLAPNRLVSVALDLKGTANVDLKGRSGLQLDLRMTNLRAEDPGHRLPPTPLALSLTLDASQNGMATELRKLELDLGATDRAKNILTLAGQVDLGTNHPAPGKLTIRSGGLDLTHYYDLFSGTSSNATAAVAPAVPGDAALRNEEPSAVHLPLRDFTADLDVSRIYLRELDMTALKGRVLVKDDHVTVDPFGFSLNGAPVRAKVTANLSVPGYEYDINVEGRSLPLAPLINSFVSDLKGLAQGELMATLKLKGAGIRGASLKRNLAGLALLQATNAQIKIPEQPIRLPGFLTWLPIFPYQLNPATVLTLIGKKAVLAEPIRVVETRVDIAQGIARITETRVASPALVAEVSGTLHIADAFTNSTLDIPILVAFADNGRLPPARRIGHEAGTVGKPRFVPDLLGLGAVGASIIPGLGPVGDRATDALRGVTDKLNQKSGGALNAVENLLGRGAATSGAPAARKGNPFGGFLKALGTGSTNKPATDTNKPANPLDLLPFGRRK